MSDLTLQRFTTARRPAGRSGVKSVITMLRQAFRTHLTRQALPELTERQLADIGVTRYAALTEAARLPWDSDPGPRRGGSGNVSGRLQQAWHRARTRRLLAEMSSQDLRDIGVPPTEAEVEANKPFWRV